MNVKNAIAASSLLIASAFASSAFALVPSSPLYDLTPAVSSQSQGESSAEDGVVLLFGIDNTPAVTIHDTLAGSTTDASATTHLIAVE